MTDKWLMCVNNSYKYWKKKKMLCVYETVNRFPENEWQISVPRQGPYNTEEPRNLLKIYEQNKTFLRKKKNEIRT